ncbi:MAG: glycosyltransferase family 9 protein [Holophaga sp.]|nr:glycosyltransferase family 9 protein [Holophaga sp.]
MERCGSDILREQLGKGANPEVWVRFPRNLGDVVFALPFFGSLQREWNQVAAEAGTRLRWIVVGHARGAALFSEARADLVTEYRLESGTQGKFGLRQLLRGWRERRPVAVINLSQSVRLALAAWLARVPIRAGDVNNHLGLLYHFKFTYRDLPVAIVERFRPLLVQLTGADRLRWQPITPERFGGLQGMAKLTAAGWTGGPYVALGFGTRGFPKRWFPEEETWPALARLLQGRGLGVVWLGGPDECELGRKLAAAVPGTFDLTGQTSIPEACAIEYAAAGIIALDTGLVHTAAATGRPTVMINAGSPELLIHPLGPRVISLRGPFVDMEDNPRTDFATHGTSAHRISPERVMSVLEALMSEERPEALASPLPAPPLSF